MATIIDVPLRWLEISYQYAASMSPISLLVLLIATASTTIIFLYFSLILVAPIPRPSLPSEKSYITTLPSGTRNSSSSPRPLPCWHDDWVAHRDEAETAEKNGTGEKSERKHTGTIDEPQVEMSVVIPAYNEEERLEIMLEEAIAFLDEEYGRQPVSSPVASKPKSGNANRSAKKGVSGNGEGRGMGGYEILIVNDGSRDETVRVALEVSQKHGLHDILRVCTLKQNRGKGGAVTHGFRHVRGKYAVFADADGASRFEDLRNLVEGCKSVEDASGRAIAVGSRAHLVGSEAVVKRSALRNTLMHSFHLLLRLLTPPATSRIRDTQCGFKLFSRTSLPHIVPYMHAEGWIFDVEMLMLAESALPGIKVAEIPIGWKEISGSKLNVMWDSLGMAWGLAVLRASWMVGVYKRR